MTRKLDASAIKTEELAERVMADGQASSREVTIRRMKGCRHALNKKFTDGILVSARHETYELASSVLNKCRGVST